MFPARQACRSGFWHVAPRLGLLTGCCMSWVGVGLLHASPGYGPPGFLVPACHPWRGRDATCSQAYGKSAGGQMLPEAGQSPTCPHRSFCALPALSHCHYLKRGVGVGGCLPFLAWRVTLSTGVPHRLHPELQNY